MTGAFYKLLCHSELIDPCFNSCQLQQFLAPLLPLVKPETRCTEPVAAHALSRALEPKTVDCPFKGLFFSYHPKASVVLPQKLLEDNLLLYRSFVLLSC